ncbi:MAG: NAD(P)-dependent oxidoreductase [Hydrococcus sp. Prado102]|jgi:3-hydroxyisobutyrate dehydrogenase|nr:NAD(P)-dependent oxidoreductase [Hydrococcus sp. Prado102]
MKIGFLGTGLMGQAMIQRLLSVRVPVIAYNRTPSKLEPLKEAGAEITNSPIEAIQASNCLILMLTNAAAIREVILLEDAASLLENRTVIQMGTISPSQSKDIQKAVLENKGDYLEAPVLGSIPEANSGKLLVMVGGTQTQFEKWSGLLQHFGTEPMLIGEVGTAAAMKLGLNQLIASLTSAFALSLSFVEKQGVDIEKFMQVLRQSALYAPTFDKKLQRMRDRNYDNPNFPTKHLLKDIDLFLAQGQEIGIDSVSLEGVRQVVSKAIELGFSDEDYSAIFSAID